MFKTLRSLARRQQQAEWLDDPNADPELIRKSLVYIRRINVLLRYTKATLSHLERMSQSWPVGKTIRILDVGTGSADIPLAILEWSRAHGFDVRVTGVDLQKSVIDTARKITDTNLTLTVANALQLPFADGGFDYVITNMFLHHLDEIVVVNVFKEMNRVASRGVIAADIIRSRGAYLGIIALTLAANPMVRHDARISVRQAFTRDEILALRDRAGIGFACYYSHAGYRFVLAGEKPLPPRSLHES
jgi:2-polyprenyl-3-methyl-5-hydroxy-6-metoxy-1,4-benzoquinol methylase